VLGDVELLAPIVDAPEASVALPVVSECDVGMVRYGRGVFRPAESREQADSQDEEKTKSGLDLESLRIAVVHESSQT
jgi:hypothetical protein